VSGPRLDQLDEKTKELVMKIIPSDPNLPWTTFALVRVRSVVLGESEEEGARSPPTLLFDYSLAKRFLSSFSPPQGTSEQHGTGGALVSNWHTHIPAPLGAWHVCARCSMR